MNPRLILGVVGVGAWMLLSKKSTPAATQPAAVLKAPTATQPGSVNVTIPSGFPSITQSAPGAPIVVGPTLTPPVVVQVPDNTPTTADYPAKVASNPSLTLTYEEQQSIESDLPGDLYQKAMASNHQVYVAAAAATLAARGDTRAADLTLRVANWKA